MGSGRDDVIARGTAILGVNDLLTVIGAVLILAAVVITGVGAGPGAFTGLTACFVVGFVLRTLGPAGSSGCGHCHISTAEAGGWRDQREGRGSLWGGLGALGGGNSDAARLEDSDTPVQKIVFYFFYFLFWVLTS